MALFGCVAMKDLMACSLSIFCLAAESIMGGG